jgi:predicted aminopeptidase
LDERAADLKSALAFYRLQVHIPASVRVRRVVWCTDHRCGCGRDKEFGGCAKVHRYFRRVWGKAMALEAEEDLALAATAGTASGDQ